MRRAKTGTARLVLLTFLIALLVTLRGAKADESKPELRASANFSNGAAVGTTAPIEITLTRAPTPEEGRVAVFIDQTDLSSLFEFRDAVLRFDAKVFPLTEGSREITVYLVSPANDWREIAKFPLTVSDSPAAQADQPSQPPAETSPAAGAEQSAPAPAVSEQSPPTKVDFVPSVTVGIQGRLAESKFPADLPSERPSADVNVQGTVQFGVTRPTFLVQSQFQVAGSSFANERLRFGEKMNDALPVDLASYFILAQRGKAKFTVGHFAFGTNRHLINQFPARGLTATLPLAAFGDVSFAAVNGTSIVGFENFFGLNKRKHQIITGTLGLELLPKRPGGLRFELAALDGSLLPISNINQGNITDAETSRGVTFHVLGTDAAQRLKFEYGFTRSRFKNADDPLLNQGNPVVPAVETTRNAQFLEAGYTFLQNASLSELQKVTLAFNYRFERIDPLYRSIAAVLQPDRNQNQFEVAGNVGALAVLYQHTRFRDNLANIPSILTNRTQQDVVTVAGPIASFFGDPNKPSPFLPAINYNFTRIRQFADNVPVNGGFDDPSAIPDQANTNQTFTADWQIKAMRVGYRFNRSLVDNRQVGRENADFIVNVNGAAFGYTHPKFDLTVDVSLENARNVEQKRTDRTYRLASIFNWKPTTRILFTSNFSGTFAGDTGNTTRNRNTELTLQGSYLLTVEKSRFRKVQGQLFLRFTNRFASARDLTFGTDTLTRVSVLSTGLNFTFF